MATPTPVDTSSFTPAQLAAFNHANAQGSGVQTYSSKVTPAATTTPSSTTSTASDTFISELQSRLLAQSGIISSSNTQLESSINSAIAGVQKSADLSGQAIASAYDREKGYAADAGAIKSTSFQESQRGFATNTAALKQIQDDTTKQLNDLEQRKQELILQGQAGAASQISNLQLQALQFRQQAQQQVFSNLLGMASFGLQAQQQQQQATQFERTLAFNENNAMSQIALQYGLSLNQGETLSSLYSRATKDMGKDSPAALALAQAQSTIARNNAEIRKITTEAGAKAYSDAELTVLANGYLGAGSGALAGVKDPLQLNRIIERASQIKATGFIQNNKAQGNSKAEVRSGILADTTMSPADQQAALRSLETVYGADSAQPKAAPAGNILDQFTDWFTGNVLGEKGMVEQNQRYRALGI